MITQVIGAVVQIGTGVAGAISQVKDVKLRREFEQKFQVLSLDQQKRLDEKVLKANTQNERIAIITNAFADVKSREYEAKTKKDTQLAFLVIGGGLAVLLTIFLIKKV